eukprot:4339473-Prymnesium_polylepis.2
MQCTACNANYPQPLTRTARPANAVPSSGPHRKQQTIRTNKERTRSAVADGSGAERKSERPGRRTCTTTTLAGSHTTAYEVANKKHKTRDPTAAHRLACLHACGPTKATDMEIPATVH